ncbi:MAG TPA: alternative ribosome rescue aminoacyl-tRNA hydrolase ArfB [Planctomycetota bacterium]|nr:alternative ribosome rescue aminoacyl-tRNA hydrolase ArfB [Planctomycetota bacterium]
MDAPAPTSAIELAPGVSIAPDELRFHFARSGGPGGQNVNKVNTKAELRIRPAALAGLSGAALHRLQIAHVNRFTTDGDLLIVADAERSQFANREACLDKLRAFVKIALIEPKIRRKTRPTKSSRERRLDSKKAHSRIKAQRRSNDY